MGESTPAPGVPPGPRRSPSDAVAVVAPLGPLRRCDVAWLCHWARVLLAGGADPVVCDVSGLLDPDVGTVDLLARLQLTALRRGRGVRLRGASRELRELIGFMGLGDVFFA